jgi:hypothetical protein
MRSDFELVFVHLGTAKASHLWANIKSIRKTLPHIPIIFVGDETANLDRAKRLGIETFQFSLDVDLERAMARSKHNLTFREGFWSYSILRLFALLKYSESKPNSPLIHIESDISIMPNFPFVKLAQLEKPSWMKFNETHDVGSIFTVPNAKHSKALSAIFYQLFLEDGSLTDMTLLSTFARKYPDLMCYLPVSEGSNDDYLRIDARDTTKSAQLSKNFALFEGIFDSAPLGMWLLGQDPRNHLGRILRSRNLSESFIQAQSIGFEFDRKLGILKTKTQIPIFNLHVHSKELKYFNLGKLKAIDQKVVDAKANRLRTSFSMRAFMKLCIDFYMRNGIMSVPKKVLSFVKF